MNHSRALNTVAFATVMLAIFFAQVKGPVNKLTSSLQGRATQVLETGYHAGTLAAVQSADLTRVQWKLQRNQAKLVCAQQVLQAKMQALRTARQVQAEAHDCFVTVSNTENPSD